METGFFTTFQQLRAEQNEKMAERFRELRKLGATKTQAADRISHEDVSLRMVNLHKVSVIRILTQMGVYE